MKLPVRVSTLLASVALGLIASCSSSPSKQEVSRKPVLLEPVVIIDMTGGEPKADSLDFTVDWFEQRRVGAGYEPEGFKHVIGEHFEQFTLDEEAESFGVAETVLPMEGNRRPQGGHRVRPVAAGGMADDDWGGLSEDQKDIYLKYCGLDDGPLSDKEWDFIASRGMARGVPAALASVCSAPK